MIFLGTVQMHRERQVRRRRVVLHSLGQQQRVRAQVDELLALDVALDDLRHFLVDQRLAAGDGHDRRTALVDRGQCVFDRNALIEDVVRIINLAAAGARQVALEQRLEHEHQGIALFATQALAHEIEADFELLM